MYLRCDQGLHSPRATAHTSSSSSGAPSTSSTIGWKWFHAACGQVSKPRAFAATITFWIIMEISILNQSHCFVHGEIQATGASNNW